MNLLFVAVVLFCSLTLCSLSVPISAKQSQSNDSSNSLEPSSTPDLPLQCPTGDLVQSLDECPQQPPSLSSAPTHSHPPSLLPNSGRTTSSSHGLSQREQQTPTTTDITKSVISCFKSTLDSNIAARHFMTIKAIENILPQCFQSAKEHTTTNTINVLR